MSINKQIFEAACIAAKNPEQGTKPVSRVIPQIIKNADAKSAAELTCTPSDNRDLWLPESLALFNTPGLTEPQKKDMLRSVYGEDIHDKEIITKLTDCSARIGRLGFSFPQWRFLARSFGQHCLFERFGMQRLTRVTDIRDESLKDPDRDELGTGYYYHDGHDVEYRRSYVHCSDQDLKDRAAIFVRNSSYFYGRDRLMSAAYISLEPLTHVKIQTVNADTLENSGRFIRWTNIIKETPGIALPEKLRRTKKLLDFLDNYNAKLSQWLCADTISGGFRELISFLRRADSEKIYLAKNKASMPPWFPENTAMVTTPVIDTLEKYGPRNVKWPLKSIFDRKIAGNLVLLSGPDGDFPVREAPAPVL